jgi:hypothetical protein
MTRMPAAWIRYHEASHALLAAHGGLTVTRITSHSRTIEPKWAHEKPGFFVQADGTTEWEPDRGSDWADLVATLGGGEGVRAIVLCGVDYPIDEGNGDDNAIATTLAEAIAKNDDRSAAEILRDAQAEARDLARRFRPAIIALAGSLASHGEDLEASEAAAAIAAAFAGRTWYRDDAARRRGVPPRPSPRLQPQRQPGRGPVAAPAASRVELPPTLATLIAGNDWSVARTSTGYRCRRLSRSLAGFERR